MEASGGVKSTSYNGQETTMYGSATVAILGGIETIYGLTLLLNKEVLAVASGTGGVVLWSGDVWGWVALILGAATLAVGLGLFGKRAWVGMAVAGAILIAVVQMATITLFPLWSALVVALCIASIYILSRESG